MGLNTTDALVIRTYKLAEADKIAILLTRQAGLLRGIAHGARKLKSRFGASLELFTHITLDYHDREGRELISLRHAEIVHSYFHLACNADTVATLNYLSSLLVDFAAPHQPDERLFRMVKACLDAIEIAPDKLPNITLYFEIWLLKLSGFLPDARICTSCRQPLGALPTFFGVSNMLQCLNCAQGGGLRVSAAAQTVLREALHAPPGMWANAGNESVSAARHEIGQVIRLLIARALERPPRGGRNLR